MTGKKCEVCGRVQKNHMPHGNMIKVRIEPEFIAELEQQRSRHGLTWKQVRDYLRSTSGRQMES